MAKVVFEQARNPFWNVPRAPEGVGSFFIGRIKSKPVPTSRDKRDGSGKYETFEVLLETMVAIEGKEEMIPMTFKVQDMAIGSIIANHYPQVPGKVMPSPVGTHFAVFYHDTNEKGYYIPDMYMGETLAEVLSDMNGDCLTRMHALQGGTDKDWRFTYSAWTPTLAEYLAKQGVKKDDLPF